ncbi:hypothetical protein CXG81DRAFT_28828 [Caulochytrium protostelioides]|uniref:Phorbol-ester/DAG-type domain-containing protein n=1 Tax=Caulochytrium protostelioides TaxID=1555241 RepID=A0A4P9X230_9FUNG|nr:hypothetical protein CXG81DRAFT_28828 [Caulochytrium protostelioides]|eukprot:RKO98330.1 hypothetical protein CXG81DRAFT_28828 [Caulochytrium protostelioides]
MIPMMLNDAAICSPPPRTASQDETLRWTAQTAAYVADAAEVQRRYAKAFARMHRRRAAVPGTPASPWMAAHRPRSAGRALSDADGADGADGASGADGAASARHSVRLPSLPATQTLWCAAVAQLATTSARHGAVAAQLAALARHAQTQVADQAAARSRLADHAAALFADAARPFAAVARAKAAYWAACEAVGRARQRHARAAAKGGAALRKTQRAWHEAILDMGNAKLGYLEALETARQRRDALAAVALPFVRDAYERRTQTHLARAAAVWQSYAAAAVPPNDDSDGLRHAAAVYDPARDGPALVAAAATAGHGDGDHAGGSTGAGLAGPAQGAAAGFPRLVFEPTDLWKDTAAVPQDAYARTFLENRFDVLIETHRRLEREHAALQRERALLDDQHRHAAAAAVPAADGDDASVSGTAPDDAALRLIEAAMMARDFELMQSQLRCESSQHAIAFVQRCLVRRDLTADGASGDARDPACRLDVAEAAAAAPGARTPALPLGEMQRHVLMTISRHSPHAWKPTSFCLPATCAYCRETIWGASSRAGFACTTCGDLSHPKCRMKAAPRCRSPAPPLASSPAPPPRARHRPARRPPLPAVPDLDPIMAPPAAPIATAAAAATETFPGEQRPGPEAGSTAAGAADSGQASDRPHARSRRPTHVPAASRRDPSGGGSASPPRWARALYDYHPDPHAPTAGTDRGGDGDGGDGGIEGAACCCDVALICGRLVRVLGADDGAGWTPVAADDGRDGWVPTSYLAVTGAEESGPTAVARGVHPTAAGVAEVAERAETTSSRANRRVFAATRP